MSASQHDLLQSISQDVLDVNSKRSRATDPAAHSSWFSGAHGLVGQAAEALGGVFTRQTQSKPLALNYGNVVLRFPTHHEFDFALSSRTETPVSRLPALHELTLFELRQMASDIRKLELRFTEVLNEALEHGQSLRQLMMTLEAKSFSSDHDWRAIFAALATSEHDGHDPYRRVALAKYMQYLRNRQEAIQHIYLTRGSESDTSEAAAPMAEVVSRAAYDTALFDLPELGNREQQLDDQWPLPRAESIGINVAGRNAFDLFLASHPFSLQCGPRPVLVDLGTGEQFPLHRGTNTIGRDPGVDVRVDADYREVSRKHLIIEVMDEHTAAFTDLSSHGTRVPPSRVIGSRPTHRVQ